MYAIRHIDIPKTSLDLFVTAEFEKKVSLWSLEKMKKIGDIDTTLDFGGSRLVLIPTDKEPIVVTGAYTRYGVSAYNLDGKKIWERKDLKKSQYIKSLKSSGELCLGIGFDEKPFHFLNVNTGDTIKLYKGVRQIFTNQDDTLWITVSDRDIKLIDTDKEVERWSKNTDILSAGFSDEKILINISHSLISYDKIGNENWRYNCPEEHIIHNVCWDTKRKYWLFILWNYINGGPKYLCKVDENGSLISKEELGEIWEYAFSGDGQLLITSDGEVIDTHNLRVVWKFSKKIIS
jgi:hypothetical protein